MNVSFHQSRKNKMLYQIINPGIRRKCDCEKADQQYGAIIDDIREAWPITDEDTAVSKKF